MKRLHVLMTVALPWALVAQDTTAVKATLIAADRAAAAGEAALARAMTPDAVVLVPGEEVLRGHAAYAKVLPAMAGAPTGRAAWTPVHAVVAHDGAFGCTAGVLNLPAVDSTQSRTGRYASCWQRGADGGWRMVAHSRALAAPQVKALPDSLPLAPGSTGTSAPRGTDAARAMADADRAFARFSADSGGPAGAFARWVVTDGMMLGGRAIPPRGPGQVRKAFAGFPADGKFTGGPIDVLAMASRDGGLGFTIGEARIAATPADVSYSKTSRSGAGSATGAIASSSISGRTGRRRRASSRVYDLLLLHTTETRRTRSAAKKHSEGTASGRSSLQSRSSVNLRVLRVSVV